MTPEYVKAGKAVGSMPLISLWCGGSQHTKCNKNRDFFQISVLSPTGLVIGSAASGLSHSSFFPSRFLAVLSAPRIHLHELTCTHVSPGKMNVS